MIRIMVEICYEPRMCFRDYKMRDKDNCLKSDSIRNRPSRFRLREDVSDWGRTVNKPPSNHSRESTFLINPIFSINSQGAT